MYLFSLLLFPMYYYISTGCPVFLFSRCGVNVPGSLYQGSAGLKPDNKMVPKSVSTPQFTDTPATLADPKLWEIFTFISSCFRETL